MIQTLNFDFVISFLYKKRKTLITVFIASLVISTISAFLIPNKYKSEAVLYPSNISPYSAETQTEQMVQLLQSNYITENIIAEFGLYTRYEIDSLKKGSKAAVLKEYEANIAVEKTEFESIQLEVYDKDPQISSKIADRILALADEKIRTMQREKSQEIVNLNTLVYYDRSKQLDSLVMARDEFKKKYGVYDFAMHISQAYSSYYSALYRKAGASAEEKLLKEIKKWEEADKEYPHSEWEYINNEISRVRTLQLNYKTSMEQSAYDVKKVFTYANVVLKPFASDKKVYPIRWLVVLSSVIASVALALFLLILKDLKPLRNINFKELDSQT